VNVGITGINGFIGSFLFEHFSREIFTVYGLSTKPENILIIKLVDGIPVNEIEDLECIIHCGGLTGNNFSEQDYHYANVFCLRKLLNWCSTHNVKQFIYFSTGGVYGALDEWVDETEKLNAEGFYARSKLKGEEEVLQCSIPIKTILRIYFPIGNLTKNHLFSRLAHQVRDGKEICLNNEVGMPYISPTCIMDIKNVLEILTKEKIGGVYNFSSNYKISIREIVETIARCYGVIPCYRFAGQESHNYLGKTDKLIKTIGYDVLVDPITAICKMIDGDYY